MGSGEWGGWGENVGTDMYVYLAASVKTAQFQSTFTDESTCLKHRIVTHTPSHQHESGTDLSAKVLSTNRLSARGNTFYLRLYGVGHMVKDQSDSERGNPLLLHRLLFPINNKGSFICTIPQTG